MIKKNPCHYTATVFGGAVLSAIGGYLTLYYVVLWPIITAHGVMDGQWWPALTLADLRKHDQMEIDTTSVEDIMADYPEVMGVWPNPNLSDRHRPVS